MPETEELSWISRPLKSYWQPLIVLTAVGYSLRGMHSPMELDSSCSLNCSSDDSVFYECFYFLLFFCSLLSFNILCNRYFYTEKVVIGTKLQCNFCI